MTAAESIVLAVFAAAFVAAAKFCFRHGTCGGSCGGSCGGACASCARCKFGKACAGRSKSGGRSGGGF